jgi:AcrR family transcriptional regulator
MNIESPPKRAYRQSARAQATEETAERIIEVFAGRLRDSWLEEIRLEDVAREAGVTVQTVIRRFGGKDGLLDGACERLNREIERRRAVAPGDVTAAVEVLTKDYEITGDVVMRMLGQEDRYPAVQRVTDVGRTFHRHWLAAAFAPWLDAMSRADAERRLDALVIATDVYVWKLLRRDMGRPLSEYRDRVETLIAAAIFAPLSLGERK